MKYLAGFLTLLASAEAHIALWDVAGYGYNISDRWSYHQAVPLWKMQFKEWWFHGYTDQPPPDGVFMELPAGGSYHGEVSCLKATTTLGGNPDPAKKKPLRPLACYEADSDKPGGGLHSHDGTKQQTETFVKGCALSIAYKANVADLKPEDFVVISVNHKCPWRREVEFKIPKGLPPCPKGGCHCLWGWNAEPGNVPQMYNLGFRCKVTGEVGNKWPAKPQVPRKCPYEKNNCTIGAKQMLYFYQAEGNNIHQDFNDGAFYNDDYGFQDGAQEDIWQLDDGARWIKNTSDWAPRAVLGWETTTKHYSNTGGVTTYPPVTNPGVAVSSIPVGSVQSKNSEILASLTATTKPGDKPTGGYGAAAPSKPAAPSLSTGKVLIGQPSNTASGAPTRDSASASESPSSVPETTSQTAYHTSASTGSESASESTSVSATKSVPGSASESATEPAPETELPTATVEPVPTPRPTKCHRKKMHSKRRL